MAAPRTHRVHSSDGTELAVLEQGDRDGTTIVLVHGYPDTKELWRGVLEHVDPGYHVVAYDVRGSGESSAPRWPHSYSIERLGDDLEAVLAAIGGDRPVHLVGHDWGGIVGWEQVSGARFSGRIASLTTIAGPSLAQVRHNVAAQLRRGRLLRAAGMVRRSWYVLALCVPGVPSIAWRALLGRGIWERYLRYVEKVPGSESHPARSLARDGTRGANLYRRNLLLAPVSDAGPAPVPVQLIVPSADRWISERYYDGLSGRASALRRRRVAGSHWAPLVHPELVAGWISEFVQEVDGGRISSSAPWRRGGGLEQLRSRLVLVTGAGSGIGRATAIACSQRGARVLLVDRDGEAARRVEEQLADAHALSCDVSDPEQMQALANRVLDEHGVPDVVVNNAGIAVSGPFLEHEFDDWRAILDVNLMGVVHGCRLFGRAMVQRGEGGQIVNTASAAAFTPVKDLPAYSASKAAVLMLSECLRSELAPYGIGVSAICPGIIATNITSAAKYVGIGDESQDSMRERVTGLYARRNFTPEQVAQEILRAIARDIAVVPVTPEAKLMRALSRISPGLLRRLVALDALPG